MESPNPEFSISFSSRGSRKSKKNFRMAEVTHELELGEPDNQNTETSNKHEKKKDTKHIIKKRQPLCFPKRKEDIYVTNKTPFKVKIYLFLW